MSIQAEHVNLCYECDGSAPAKVLCDINFCIEDGAFVGVMGRTGCGKTSLMQLCAGLLSPTSGRILFDGEDINAPRYDKKKLRSALGFVFQYPEYQLFETTVARDVAFCLKHSGLSKAQIAQRVKEALFDVGFDESILSVSPLSLSGGQKRRVAIAGVLAAKPRVLILDEPIAGLDPHARHAFMALLARLNHQGTSILMISHNADVLAETCDRLLVLDDGRLVMDAPPKEVFSDVSRLDALHHDVSFARRTAHLLQQSGIDMPQDTVRYDELLQKTVQLLGGARP